jgi:hypothetical protein
MQSRGIRCPSSSSISKARFVTAGAIDPKLCTYVPLGKSNSRTKVRSSLMSDSCVDMYLGTIYISTEFRPDWTSNMAARRPSWKTNKVLLYSWTNGWIISKFLSWIHLILRYMTWYPGFWFDLLFEGHIGQSSKQHQYWHVSLLFDLEHSNLVWTCI